MQWLSTWIPLQVVTSCGNLLAHEARGGIGRPSVEDEGGAVIRSVFSGKQWAVGLIGAVALVLSACGGGSSTGAGPGHSHGHRGSVGKTMGPGSASSKTGHSGAGSGGSGGSSGPGGSAGSGGSGGSSGPGGSAGSGLSQAGGLKLSSLSSLQNYTFQSTMEKHSPSGYSLEQVSGRVHSPTNWQAAYSGLKVPSTPINSTYYDVSGTGYVDTDGSVSSVSFNTPEGADHLRGEAYFAKKLLYDIQDRGLKLTSARGCYIAGISGNYYNLGNPVGSSSIQQGDVCIANGSGALLSYFLRWPLGPSATASSDVEVSSFTVSGANDVSAISAP